MGRDRERLPTGLIRTQPRRCSTRRRLVASGATARQAKAIKEALVVKPTREDPAPESTDAEGSEWDAIENAFRQG